MSIFKRKQKVILEEFCRDFYDKNLLNPIIGDINLGVFFTEGIKNSIVEVCPSFVKIDIQTLLHEITLLRFEIFSLAFLHHFGDKNTAAQSQFTKLYLEENKRDDIWKDLEAYNQAIATSSKLNQNLETKKGRAYIVFADRMRMNLYDLWAKQGFDSKCVARAANRIMTDIAWKKNLTQNRLMLAFCKKLGYQLNEELKLCNHFGDEFNEEAQFRIISIFRGFYNGSIDALKEVVIK